MGKHHSSANNCMEKGKNRWSPFNFKENEMNVKYKNLIKILKILLYKKKENQKQKSYVFF